MIGVILPSRGLIFSETAEEILNNLKGIPHKIYFAHGKSLPECFNEPVGRALKDTVTHLWFIEDDMIVPPNTLKNLMEADANVVTCDYPITKDGKGAIFYDQGGNVVFCGTGCLLVRREVLENLKPPYFTDKIAWTPMNYGDAVKLVGRKADKDVYGLHDVTFCLRLWKNGVKVKVIPMQLGQRKLIALGKSGSNDGAHNIEKWHKIKKNARLKEILSQPLSIGAKSKLVAVRTATGEVSALQGHAEKLVSKGLASYPPKSYLILDDSEVEL